MELSDIICVNSQPLKPIPSSLTLQGKLPRKVQALLFDVYGTLFISGSGDIGMAQKQSGLEKKIKTLLNKYKIKETPRTIQERFFAEIEKTRQKLKRKGIDYPEVVIEKIWKQVLKISAQETTKNFALEYELIVNPVYPMPQAEKLLNYAQEKNILQGLISNAQFFTPLLFPALLKKNLKALGFHKDLMFFSYKKHYAKPSLFLYNEAKRTLRKKNIKPGHTLYVGNDMLNDIYPAKKTGFMTALFAGDQRSLRLRTDDKKVKNISADLVITDLIQIIDYMES